MHIEENDAPDEVGSTDDLYRSEKMDFVQGVCCVVGLEPPSPVEDFFYSCIV